MEKKRPQLNLTELYQLKWILGGILAVLSAWNVLYMDVDAWLWLLLITVTVPVVMRWPVLTLYIPH
jgi:protein-glutamine gamma-glutamyltransferase